MNSILELADIHADRIRNMGARAIAYLHAAGTPAYVMGVPGAEPNDIVRLDPDGGRFVVRRVGENFEIMRELPEASGS